MGVGSLNDRFQPTTPVVTPRAGHGARQPGSRLKPTLGLTDHEQEHPHHNRERAP